MGSAPQAALPAHWGKLPGYGEVVADPKKLPPYREDLGHGLVYTVSVDGTEEWRHLGVLHSVDDKPAVTCPDGSKQWYTEGYCNRGGGKPAIVRADGYQAWYCYGMLHRDGDQPAVIRSNGANEWWQHAKCTCVINCTSVDDKKPRPVA